MAENTIKVAKEIDAVPFCMSVAFLKKLKAQSTSINIYLFPCFKKTLRELRFVFLGFLSSWKDLSE